MELMAYQSATEVAAFHAQAEIDEPESEMESPLAFETQPLLEQVSQSQ
jgi:hypothetical protein